MSVRERCTLSMISMKILASPSDNSSIVLRLSFDDRNDRTSFANSSDSGFSDRRSCSSGGTSFENPVQRGQSGEGRATESARSYLLSVRCFVRSNSSRPCSWLRGKRTEPVEGLVWDPKSCTRKPRGWPYEHLNAHGMATLKPASSSRHPMNSVAEPLVCDKGSDGPAGHRSAIRIRMEDPGQNSGGWLIHRSEYGSTGDVLPNSNSEHRDRYWSDVQRFIRKLCGSDDGIRVKLQHKCKAAHHPDFVAGIDCIGLRTVSHW